MAAIHRGIGIAEILLPHQANPFLDVYCSFQRIGADSEGSANLFAGSSCDGV
jgi:hypothetical protein